MAKKITKTKTRESYNILVDDIVVASVELNPETQAARINADMGNGKLAVADMDAKQCEEAAALLVQIAKKAQAAV